jgi:hypothetical protein
LPELVAKQAGTMVNEQTRATQKTLQWINQISRELHHPSFMGKPVPKADTAAILE